MNVNDVHKMMDPVKSTETMPVLFIGHGNPMNAIEDNEFSEKWQMLGKTLPEPSVILCISAHWETPGTYVTAMSKPKTIHDFGGFPQSLFDVSYPAPGSPATAEEIIKLTPSVPVLPDERWGLDHGCWSVLKRMYPQASIPVVEMSLDYRQTPQFHIRLAKELATLRKKGVLIMGSGNLVHNLRKINWHEPESAYGWATEANERMKKLILEGNLDSLAGYPSLGREVNMAVPTPEHFLPILYSLSLKEDHESVSFFNDRIVMGSLSMTSIMIQ